MLKSGRYLYVLFCCQQVIEKTLKAVIVDKTAEFPPRIHNLPRLSEVAEIAVDEAQMDFLTELSAYYIQTRYPEEIASLGEKVTKKIAAETLRQTEETSEWLLSMLK